MHKELNY